MYLKKLDVLGFKSFANKTTIRFADGVTAIVGPNGCGKTNVLDSLRWVLGEQKVSLLRSGKMEEVIFNGTRDVKPLNMAEVSLTIVNNRGVLPTEYTEVQISRRLFRNGDSEYLLNKVPCRLKDIIDLFLDTGMGAHSYSVIQADMIDAVLSDRAEERRFLFEEAAGITKYKQRKKAALRKLESTENDFLRLRDIHAEVKTRVNSLYRQHKKAERYQLILNDIKAWELFLSATRTATLESEKRELRGQLDALSEDRTSRETVLDQIVAQLEADRKELIDIEHQLNQVGSEIYETSEQAHSVEKEISVTREKRTNASDLIDKNRADIESLTHRSLSLADQAAEAGRELVSARQKVEDVAGQLKAAEEAQAEADRRLLAARGRKEQENKKLIELEGKLSSGRTEEHNLREQETENSQLLEDVKSRLTELKPRQDSALSEYEARQNELADLVRRKRAVESRQAEITSEMESLDNRVDELTAEISNITASVEACEARRNLLEDMMLQYEGYESGLVAVMEEKEHWPGIAGTVGEKFVPVEGLETALEAALGELARCLICYDRKTAEGIIGYLKAKKKGKVGILVPDAGTINPAVKRPEIDLEEFVGWLDAYVTTDENLRFLKEAALSRTAIFKAGASPNELLKHLPYGFSAVSTDGVLYSRNLISGGSDDHFPLFRRKEKVQEQESMIQELTEKLKSMREEKSRLEAKFAGLRAESHRLTGDQEELVEAVDETRKRVSELEFEQRTLAGEYNRLEKERSALSNKLESIRNRQYELGLGFSQLASEKDTLVNDMTLAGTHLDELERAAVSAMEQVSRLHVAMIEARSKVQQIESQIGHINEIQNDIQTTSELKNQEMEEAEQTISQSGTRIAELESSLKDLFEQRERHNERQNSLRSVQSEIQERVDLKEKQTKEIRGQKDSVLERLHQQEIRLNSIDSEIRGIRDRILEDYEVDINTVEPTRPDEKITDDQARQYLQEQKERLKKFGAVNLLALEEYETASEREKFLSEQLNDLDTAKRDLQTTITRINHTARQLFFETFSQVRENFQKLFVELFSGGEADIRLEDDSDPLESNIEIVARPRGKKILSITQMSGGERALTAISLLFSLYLVKPSPFCILDEIDAPLDDANCHRFLKIIKKFSDQTQFITITHNKITMEAADNLYGITMEQPGISQLVAVKFTEEDEYAILEHRPDADEKPSADDNGGRESSASLPDQIQERINPTVNITPDEET